MFERRSHEVILTALTLGTKGNRTAKLIGVCWQRAEVYDQSVTVTGDDHPSMRRIPAILIAVLICGAIAFVVVAVWRAVADHRARFATLPDGSTVELQASLVGGATFSTETKWEKIARRWLPNRLAQRLPPNVSGSISHGSNSVEVYLRVTPWRAGGQLPWAGFTTEDEAGFCYPGEGGRGTIGDPSTGRAIQALALRCYPRRQREFLLHLKDNNGKTIATLCVTNPLPGPFPDWRPLPLPQTQTNGPVTLTLKSLKMHTNQWGPHCSPEFSVQATDPAWAKARPPSWTLQDATGNEGTVLSPREPAWKVRTLVYRARREDFASNEQLVLTGLPLPGAGQFVSIDEGADCAGVGIKVLVIGGAGKFGLSNGVTRFMVPGSPASGGHSTSSSSGGMVETWDSSTPFLLIEARNTRPDDEIQVHVRDDSGREVVVEMNGYSGLSGGVRTYLPGFIAPAGAKSVTVTAVVNRPLVYDFLVNPADVVGRDSVEP